ncbi:uncharacterized protein LOC133188198 [Saccostrea echinata]|uniref:uncharacterized protein LOC133188198 n=1 Tax=Saccostrea echinata TaxID=191078 RepID=UPI002A82250C|nr:uncharacterized protein LOC133188198 [Saccostrea echinata]
MIRKRHALYLMMLSLLVGFVLGVLYTSSFSGLIMTRKDSSLLQVSHKGKSDSKSTENRDATRLSTILTRPEFWGTVITRSDTGWQKMEKFCDPSAKFVRTQLRGPQQTPINVYAPQEDKWVSGNIIRRGIWEGKLVKRIHDILKNEPKVVFLDIGANVGVFSLTVAKLGRYVIAVDALDGNVARLCRSVQDGKLGSHMTIIHNALSNQREKVALGSHKRNVGGTYVKRKEKLLIDRVGQNKMVVNAILLDDLLEIFNIEKAVIKMDVEMFEANVLKGAEKFFKAVRVEYLLMEFVSHRGKESGDFIVDFLKNHSLVSEYSDSNHATWSGEVMFKRVPL